MYLDEPVIRTENLTKFYGKHPGILNVNLAVPKGVVFGYLGPNGAGKTTTIRILLDLIRPSSGISFINGASTIKSRKSLCRKIGYLPGELALYNDLTCDQFLTYLQNLRGCDCRAEIKKLSDRLDINPGQRIDTLSQGNKQKLGLAQAFMHKPEIIILDEPTNGLDPLIRQELFHMIDEVKKDGGTVFLSSHVLSEVERTCDRVAIIRNGKIVVVENIMDIQIQALHDVEIHFLEDVDVDVFAKLGGVSDITMTKNILKCRLKGEMDQLVKLASRYRIKNFFCHQPSLEEIFLAYYGDQNHAS